MIIILNKLLNFKQVRRDIDDFYKISNKLDWFYTLACFDNELPILQGLKQVILEIMNKNQINNAINMVANHLITDRIIEGDALTQLIADTRNIIDDFSIEPYVNKLEKMFPFTKSS